MNKLFYGDNLKILRDRNYFPGKPIYLIYLDSPLNSNRNYNESFKDALGEDNPSPLQEKINSTEK